MTRRRDDRFYALVDLAASGEEEAVHELWLVYRYDFEREGDPRNRLPTQPLSENQTNQKES